MSNGPTAELGVYTFGRLGKAIPPHPHYIFDVSGVRDPLSNRGFRNTHTDGRAGAVQAFVKEDPRIEAILENVEILAYLGLRGAASSKKWLSLGFRDHHGLWASASVGEIVADHMRKKGYTVSLIHYEIEKRGAK